MSDIAILSPSRNIENGGREELHLNICSYGTQYTIWEKANDFLLKLMHMWTRLDERRSLFVQNLDVCLFAKMPKICHFFGLHRNTTDKSVVLTANKRAHTFNRACSIPTEHFTILGLKFRRLMSFMYSNNVYRRILRPLALGRDMERRRKKNTIS